MQNGADAVAIYADDAANFPSGTAVTTTNLIDSIVYDTSDADDAGLLVLLNAGQPQVDENSGGDSAGQSSQRSRMAAAVREIPTPTHNLPPHLEMSILV